MSKRVPHSFRVRDQLTSLRLHVSIVELISKHRLVAHDQTKSGKQRRWVRQTQ